MTDRIPGTPFDKKIDTARREAEAQEEAIEDASRRCGEYGQEIHRLIAEAEDRGSDPDPKRLDELEQKRAAAEQDYIRADELRLRARARLTALEAMRERYLLQEFGIFPERTTYGPMGSSNGERRAQGDPGARSGDARAEQAPPAPSRAPSPSRCLAAGVKSDPNEPERKDG